MDEAATGLFLVCVVVATHYSVVLLRGAWNVSAEQMIRIPAVKVYDTPAC